MTGLRIVEDDLTGPEIAALLGEHLAAMREHSPACSVHALDLDALRDSAVRFWTAWRGAELAGCGALRELAVDHGELKSMRTSSAHLRRGVAAALLTHITAEARSRGYARLSLETGSSPAFDPARRLYERHGFTSCDPFADYTADPFSRFYALDLT